LRYFAVSLTLAIFLLTACSSDFKHYKLSSQKELATTSYKSVRLLNAQKRSEMVISTVYLNQVYPKYAGGYAHFIVSFYNPASDNRLYFNADCNQSEETNTTIDADLNTSAVQSAETPQPCSKRFVLLLNGEDAVASEHLESDDLLLELMPINNSWNQYYYVRYKLPSAKPVLRLENGHTVKAVITY